MKLRDIRVQQILLSLIVVAVILAVGTAAAVLVGPQISTWKDTGAVWLGTIGGLFSLLVALVALALSLRNRGKIREIRKELNEDAETLHDELSDYYGLPGKGVSESDEDGFRRWPTEDEYNAEMAPESTYFDPLVRWHLRRRASGMWLLRNDSAHNAMLIRIWEVSKEARSQIIVQPSIPRMVKRGKSVEFDLVAANEELNPDRKVRVEWVEHPNGHVRWVILDAL